MSGLLYLEGQYVEALQHLEAAVQRLRLTYNDALFSFITTYLHITEIVLQLWAGKGFLIIWLFFSG